MCLAIVFNNKEHEDYFNCSNKVYKIFMKNKDNTYSSVFYGTDKYKVGEWYEVDVDVADKILYTNNPYLEKDVAYKNGFHCFIKLKDSLHMREYISHKSWANFPHILAEVEIEDVVAYGIDEYSLCVSEQGIHYEKEDDLDFGCVVVKKFKINKIIKESL